MKKLYTIIFLCCFFSSAFSQNESDKTTKQVYIGAGLGLDYGGIVGTKFELLPIKELGLFGGLGYNFLGIGWNVGVSYKIAPSKIVTPDLTVMYGYNGVIVGDDSYARKYETTSYGVTIGGGIDIKIGRRGHKLSTKLLIPFRSSSFMDKHDAMENDRNIDATTLFPIAISVGYNFPF